MRADCPTIFLSNWSSSKTPGMHGPGRKYTIMAAPRSWEHGDGTVGMLVPNLQDLILAKRRIIDVDEYKRRFLATVNERCTNGINGDALAEATVDAQLAPDVLMSTYQAVRSGDTLCCACSRDDAAAGRCHRSWAADLLVAAGWRVVLDGVETPTLADLYDDVGTFGVWP